MEWTGEALLIGVRRHGEANVIAEAMVAGRGRCMGLVRGGRSSKQAAALQPGNTVQLTWRARLEDHLGTFNVEVLQSRAATLMADRTRLYLAQTVFEHLHQLPERDPHDRLLGMALDLIDSPPHGADLARFELALLDELGFGLDLETCAATGLTTGLTHVSPRTGRAVSREAAQPYLDRLLPLPAFLTGRGNASPDELAAAFRLTGHFLDMHLWSARGLAPPQTRDALITLLVDQHAG